MDRLFHPFSVEMGETRLALTDSSDRQVEAKDKHVSSPTRGDDSHTPGYGIASRP